MLTIVTGMTVFMTLQMQLCERMLQVFNNLKQKMIKGLQKIKRQKVQKVLDVIQ